MADAKRRPLKDGEKRLLKSYTAGPWRHVLPLAWGFLFFWFAVYFAVSTAWYWLAPYAGATNVYPPKLPILWLSGLLVAAYVGRSFVRIMRHEFSARRDPDNLASRAKRDLDTNTAILEKFGVTAAVEIAEFEDEGTGFFLALDDGRVLFVRSQDLYDYAHDATGEPADGIEDERHKFPQTRIAYTYAPLSGISLDIAGIGEPLRPRSLATTTRAHFRNKNWEPPQDGTFYDGPLEAVLARFNYPEMPLPPDPPRS